MGIFVFKKSVDPLAKTQLYVSWNGLSYCRNPLGFPISVLTRWMEAYVLALIPCMEHR